VWGAPSVLSPFYYFLLFFITRTTIELSDLHVFAPDGQATHTSFLLVINPVHVCSTFRPLADAENA
jgi:hypothetical protein